MLKTDVDIQTLERHQLSALFGDMPSEDFNSLVASIQRDGLMDSTLKLLDGKVLDGWHRYKACKALDVLHCLVLEAWDDVSDGDPKAFVLARNIERRHLTPAQRSQISVTLSERFKKGDIESQRSGVPNGTPKKTREELAKEAGVSKRTIARAIEVEKAGEAEAVISGEKSVSEALHQTNRQKAHDASVQMWTAYEKSELSDYMDKDEFTLAASKAIQCPSEWSKPKEMEEPGMWIVRFQGIKKALESESGWVKELLDGFRKTADMTGETGIVERQNEEIESGDLDSEEDPKKLPTKHLIPTQALLRDIHQFLEKHGENAINVIDMDAWASREDADEGLMKSLLNKAYQSRYNKIAYVEETPQKQLFYEEESEDTSDLPDECVIEGYDIRFITINMKQTDSDTFKSYTFEVKTGMPSEAPIPISIIPDENLKVLMHLAKEYHRDVKVKQSGQ